MKERDSFLKDVELLSFLSLSLVFLHNRRRKRVKTEEISLKILLMLLYFLNVLFSNLDFNGENLLNNYVIKLINFFKF